MAEDVYRKVYLRLWRHPSFIPLPDGERVMALYLLAGPQTNRIGCYYFSPALAAEDLGISTAQVAKRLDVVCKAFRWEWRPDLRVMFIPSWLEWNRPNGKNALKAWHQDAITVRDETLRGRLLDAIAMASPRRTDGVVTQEQEQEQEQEVPPNPPVPGGRKVTKRELRKAAQVRTSAFGRCPHEPRCQTYDGCLELLALEARRTA